jgi:ribosomal protein S11
MKNLAKKHQRSNALPRHAFSHNCARLHIRRVRQNTFFTITDLSNRVVAAISLGLMTPSRNKRVKLAATTLERVYLRVRSILGYNAVNQVTLLLRSLVPR